MVDKAALLADVIRHLEAERDTLAAAQRASQAGATHEEARSEGDKDMRATEVSYLARGQAERVVALESEIARLKMLALRAFGEGDAIAAGALVTLSSKRGKSVVFLLPAGAGTKLSQRGAAVNVVTPASPLGSVLLGARAGDAIDVELGERVDEYDVDGVE